MTVQKKISRVVGIDCGNGLTNVRSVYPDGSPYVLTLPSIYNHAEKEGVSLGFDTVKAKDLEHITVDGVEYIWGEGIAYISDPIETASTMDTRYQTSNFKTFVKVILGKVAKDIDIQPTEHILVSTGVPSAQTNNKAAVEAIKKAFMGDSSKYPGLHKVEVEGTEYIINVADVIVTSQPLATVFSVYLDDNGKVADPTIPNKKIGVADIGGGTTDLDTVLPGFRRASNFASEGTGFNDVYYKIQKYIAEVNNANIQVSEYVLLDIIQQAEAKAEAEGTEPVYLFKGSERQKEVDFTEVYRNALIDLGRDVNTIISKRWKDYKSFDKIYLVGGSAKRIAPYVEILDEPDFPRDPGLSNVEGYFRFGMAYVNNKAKSEQ
ncbi:Alp7A family actin-like protein [Caldibacillus debilis]|uniref:StbA protein n=1 Tax=Caldibacillus debilis GB1 TaxID=1339248 RepID=A0A420VEP6_9BACI|nr:hypothetical protein [Caldibacillus debilis]RKO61843.1 StbA protein [Caldibacillus debilis GB1]